MIEYAIFNDEGCIDRGFSDVEQAHLWLVSSYSDEPGIYVAEMCPDHDEQPRDNCEECNAE